MIWWGLCVAAYDGGVSGDCLPASWRRMQLGFSTKVAFRDLRGMGILRKTRVDLRVCCWSW